MKSASRLFAGLLVVTTGLWLLADTPLPEPFGWFPFRTVFVQYSGAMAIAAMSMAMILALRWGWLEQRLNGLDKSYRLHKWLGITALVTSVTHWWFAQGTKWMVGWGWLERPARGPRPEETLGLIEETFRSLRGFAESVGEWAFYAAALLMVLALIKRFPYHWFRKTHTLLALAYLVLAFHSVILIKFEYWAQPIGWLLVVLLAAGVWSAILVLAGRVGRHRKVEGEVAFVNSYPDLKVVETGIRLASGWGGHRAGQFAFVKTAIDDEPHPFTIASAWNPADQKLVFVTKALGDYTSRMLMDVKPGQTITVEGPYGCFDFDDQKEHQVWIGAGIGITPFIARMQELAAAGHASQVDLYHCTAETDDDALARLRADAAAAGIRLHLVISGRDERLSAKTIKAQVPQWQQASFWFCGPSGFGRQLREDLTAAGLGSGMFHQELFEMR